MLNLGISYFIMEFIISSLSPEDIPYHPGRLFGRETQLRPYSTPNFKIFSCPVRVIVTKCTAHGLYIYLSGQVIYSYLCCALMKKCFRVMIQRKGFQYMDMFSKIFWGINLQGYRVAEMSSTDCRTYDLFLNLELYHYRPKRKGLKPEYISNMNAQIVFLMKEIIEKFSRGSYNSLYTFKFHPIYYFVEDFKIFGTIHVLHASLFEYLHLHITRLYRETSKRHRIGLDWTARRIPSNLTNFS